MKRFKFGLLPRILVAIVLGIVVGNWLPLPLTRVFITFNSIFGQFLGFMIVKTIYGVCAKLFPVFTDFDFVSYENNLWWYYTPQRIGYTRIFYLLAAIIFSVCVQYAINFVKCKYRKIKDF